MSQSKSVPIAIIGGGLAGLMLARVLHQNGIPSTVFEADDSAAARPQGGLLDIHEYNGQIALKDAGLYDSFLELVLPGADAQRVLDKSGRILHEDFDKGQGTRPEVHREALRQLLIDSIPADSIEWGSKVDQARTLDSGAHEVTFKNGLSITTPLLIGADGAWSKIRPLVSPARPHYVGTTFVELFLYNSDLKFPDAARAVGPGTLIAVAPGQGILAHRESNGTLHAYVAFNQPEDWFQKFNFHDAQQSLKQIENEFADWAPELRSIIRRSESRPILRAIYALPVDHRWDRVPGVTLIGDAAHLMSPFAGEGANLALYDGSE
ncbi:MAG: FAD-dependent monooxygenase, partial [Proteobacteria bacterium]